MGGRTDRPRRSGIDLRYVRRGYVFDGQTTRLWYDNGISICLTFGFDLSLANNQLLINNTVDAVLTFWEAALLANQTEVPAALAGGCGSKCCVVDRTPL